MPTWQHFFFSFFLSVPSPCSPSPLGHHGAAPEADPEILEAQAYVRKLHAYLEPRMLRRLKQTTLLGELPAKVGQEDVVSLHLLWWPTSVNMLSWPACVVLHPAGWLAAGILCLCVAAWSCGCSRFRDELRCVDRE